MSTSGDGRSLGLSEDLSRLSVRDDEALTSGFDESKGILPQTGPRLKDEISDLKKTEVLKQQLGSSNAETNDVEKEDEVVKKEKAKKKNKDVKKKNKDMQSDEAPTSGFDKSRGMLPQTGPRSKDEISDLKELGVVKQQLRSSHAETNDVEKEDEVVKKKKHEDALKEYLVLKKEKEDAKKKNEDAKKKNEDVKMKIVNMLVKKMGEELPMKQSKEDAKKKTKDVKKKNKHLQSDIDESAKLHEMDRQFIRDGKPPVQWSEIHPDLGQWLLRPFLLNPVGL